jgi:hypothetical protein
VSRIAAHGGAAHAARVPFETVDPPEPGEAVRRRRELADRYADLYLRWRLRCIALQEACEAWSAGAVGARRELYSAYQAALKREHVAARSLESCWWLAVAEGLGTAERGDDGAQQTVLEQVVC